MEAWTFGHDAHELMIRLQEAGVPAGVVAKAEDLHNDPQLTHRRHFVMVDHPVLGSYSSDAAGFRLSAARLRAPAPSPCLGEHNERVTKEILGLSHDEWLRCREAGAFG
jgi:benzylsuccinate CoA-transferase BbsF subunit